VSNGGVGRVTLAKKEIRKRNYQYHDNNNMSLINRKTEKKKKRGNQWFREHHETRVA
jgi:hypothetical protein